MAHRRISKVPPKSASPLTARPVTTINQLPAVDQIERVHYERSSLPSETRVFVEYTDRQNEWHELEIPLPDAMYLLNLLRQIEREAGFNTANEPLPDE